MINKNKHRSMAAAIAILTLFAISGSARAQANEARCPCDFAEPKWQGYGTGAACSTYMNVGQTSCQVDFGGTGANPNLISKALGVDSRAYQRETFEVLIAYLQYLENGKKADLN